MLSEVRFTYFSGPPCLGLTVSNIAAHYQAATHPRTLLLHGDISTKNILIYPQVRHDNEGDKAAIVWTGLLCDWELAKPIDPRLQESLSATASSPQMVGLWYHYYIPNEAH